MCPCEYVAGKVSLRVQELKVRLETKTLDNVFVSVDVSVQYQVNVFDEANPLYFIYYNLDKSIYCRSFVRRFTPHFTFFRTKRRRCARTFTIPSAVLCAQ